MRGWMERIAESVARKAWRLGPSEFMQEGRRVRRMLMEAARQLAVLARENKGGELEKVTKEALEGIDEAVAAVDKMLGAGLSVHIDEQVGFISRDLRVAAPRWSSVAQMRRDVDEMESLARGWLDRERKDTRRGMSYVPYYGAAVDALEDCSERLHKVEHLI